MWSATKPTTGIIMTSKPADRQFLRRHGLRLVENGYWIHPVRHLRKVPDEDGWQKVRADEAQCQQWLDNGHADSGVCVILGNVLAIDIDVKDETIAEHMARFVFDRLGRAPIRIGQAPKCAIVVRAAVEGIRKTKSAVMESWDGEHHHVEVLANGQQLVAYNIHPDTKRPYSWEHAEFNHGELTDFEVDDLPECGLEDIDAIIAEFGRVCAEHDMVEFKRAGAAAVLDQDELDELYLENLAHRGTARDDIPKLRETLALLASRGYADDHEQWFAIGMALHHEFHGDEQGRELWIEFSEQAQFADVGGFDRWDSFAENTYGARPVTLGSVFAWAKEERETLKAETLSHLENIIDSASNAQELERAANDDLSRLSVELSRVSRRQIEDQLQAKFKSLGVKLSKPDVQRLLRPKTAPAEITLSKSQQLLESEFSFLKGWAWSTETDAFVHIAHGRHSPTSFRAKFEREFLKYDDAAIARFVDPEGRYTRQCFDPVWFAHNIIQVPHVAGTMYAPGFDTIFKADDDRFYFNAFRPWVSRLPVAYDWEWTQGQEDAVERFKRMVQYACGGTGHTKETELVLSWIASRYQRPEKKHRWALFFWGPKGSGKSSIGDYLTRLFGADAVAQVSPAEIESPFNGYSGGAVINIVDEIDVSSRKNKQQIVTGIRADITQDRVSRIRKGVDGVNVYNFTDYIFLSNEADGIPIDEGERRYMVLSSAFKTRDEARAGMVHSGLRDRVERDLNDQDCLAAIRGFLEAYELHPEFNPSDAPETDAKRQSTETGRSVIQLEVADIMEDKNCWFASETFVSVPHLHRELVRRARSGVSPDVDPSIKRNVLSRVLGSEPFNLHDTARFRLGDDRCVVKHSGSFDADAFKAIADSQDDWEG